MPKIRDRRGRSLFPFQVVGSRFLRQQGRALLADDMGLGKTVQALTAASAVGGRALVVAPAIVLQSGSWEAERDAWAPGLELDQVSYSSLHKVGPGRFSTLILDEAHRVKNRNAKCTAQVAELQARSEQVYMLSGTPFPNWASEMFSLVRLARPQDALPGKELGSYWRWADEWFGVSPGRHTQYQVGSRLRACSPACDLRDPADPCEHYAVFMRANWGDRFLRRTRDEVLPELPALTQQQVDTPMGARQKAEYRRMKREFLADVGDGLTVAALTSSAQFVALSRLSTGLSAMPGAEWDLKNSSKLARLRDDLAERFLDSRGRVSKARPVLVFAWYRETVDACARVAADLGLRVAVIHGGVSDGVRREALNGFSTGGVDVLVGSLATLREGVTLTQSDLVVFVEQAWVPAVNEQAMRRVHRLGQTRPVQALVYHTPGSVDLRRLRVLAAKADSQARFLSRSTLDALLGTLDTAVSSVVC